MSFVTARDVAAAFDGGKPLPPNAVMVSFDDGRLDSLLWATPLLQDADAVATMFVISGAADEPSVYYADWAELAGFAAGGDVWDLQSHTHDLHRQQETRDGELPALTSLAPGESLPEYRERVARDLDRADERLSVETGRRPVTFAYPFGAWGADRTNDPRIRLETAREVGRRYRLAFHQDDQEQVTLATADDPRIGIRRMAVGDWSGLELVEQIAAAHRRSSS